ncbi:MAG: chemotaxis protein [Defluviitaleaceae bacterium]|nr:chemotaxis protein [Defluviitaleaceae bacterium]
METKETKKEILLEVGTNELEIMEFLVAGRSFGINVAKVLEIMKYEEVTPVPQSSPFVEGIFKPRSQIITVVDLAAYLNLGKSDSSERDILIITNFNKNHTAFHVHSVEIIHRISWTHIEKPDETITSGVDGITTGIARVGERLITILDFEKIMTEINPSHSISISDVKPDEGNLSRNEKTIFVVEDSPFLKKIILECLHKAGYKNTIFFSTGQEAWNALSGLKPRELSELEQIVSCVITDIEMPEMDGHTLTKLIKTDPNLRRLPTIIFSSLISEEMALKGKSVGADAQISKPEINLLVGYLDSLCL